MLSIIAVMLFMSTSSLNANAVNLKADATEQIILKKTCFAFYHEIFHQYYGGINLDNVADFNYLVAQCQATFE